jgi:formylmethanofuran dehydrogenase subunit E
MLDNFNVTLDIRKNSQDEIEVNGFNRRTLINNNLLGKHYLNIGLSLYELACQPREVKEYEKVSLDIRKIDKIIKETLRCNICLQIFHDPVNIKTCLHKFCKKCIEDYNRRM